MDWTLAWASAWPLVAGVVDMTLPPERSIGVIPREPGRRRVASSRGAHAPAYSLRRNRMQDPSYSIRDSFTGQAPLVSPGCNSDVRRRAAARESDNSAPRGAASDFLLFMLCCHRIAPTAGTDEPAIEPYQRTTMAFRPSDQTESIFDRYYPLVTCPPSRVEQRLLRHWFSGMIRPFKNDAPILLIKPLNDFPRHLPRSKINRSVFTTPLPACKLPFDRYPNWRNIKGVMLHQINNLHRCSTTLADIWRPLRGSSRTARETRTAESAKMTAITS